MASKYFKAFNAIKNLVKGGTNVAPTITGVKPGKNLKAIREMKDEFIKMVDDKAKKLSIDKKSQLKREAVEGIDKINKKYGKDAGKLEFKKRGGRIGYKKGTGKTGVAAMDVKTKISLAKKKKKNQGDLGMQSVKYGLDKNPNVTAADPKAKFIAANKKNKKKVI